MLFFAYEPERKSVVIGPVLINKPTGATWLNEFGGTVTVPGRFGKPETRRYAERAYMWPALQAETAKHLPGMFKDSVT
jgi:hypothetical protein